MMSKPLSRKTNIVVQELNDEVLVYELNSNKAYCLNETSALVWQNCNGKNTVSDLSDILSVKLGELVTIDVVEFAISELAEAGLFESDFDGGIKYTRSSRREVIKRIGFSSVVALPLVASIMAPKAVQAQSCGAPPLPDGCMCTSTAQCAGPCCHDAGGRGTGICEPQGGGVCL